MTDTLLIFLEQFGNSDVFSFLRFINILFVGYGGVLVLKVKIWIANFQSISSVIMMVIELVLGNTRPIVSGH